MIEWNEREGEAMSNNLGESLCCDSCEPAMPDVHLQLMSTNYAAVIFQRYRFVAHQEAEHKFYY